jgi:predicted dehydrogenase
VLGQGSIGRRHAGLLRELGCDVVVFDPLAAQVAEGVERAASMDAALATAAAVVIASPTSEHLDQIRAAIEHGCHTLVEKPLAVSLDNVDGTIALARERGLILAVAMNLRFHPGPRRLKEIVEAGQIGRPLTAHFTFGYHLPSWRPGTDYTRSYSARSELGGGVLLDVIHEIDYATWLLGDISEVSGWVERISQLQVDVEDVALLHARFASGALGSFSLDYLDRSYRRGAHIAGDLGSARWSWRDEVVEVFGGDGRVEAFPAPSAVDESYRLEIAEFMSAVEAGSADTGSTQLVDARAGRGALAVVEAARRSAADRGCRVRVDAG